MDYENPTPEEDEAFADLEKKLQPIPDECGVIKLGRKIEHLGKMLQNHQSTLQEISDASFDAGLKVQMRIVGEQNET